MFGCTGCKKDLNKGMLPIAHIWSHIDEKKLWHDFCEQGAMRTASRCIVFALNGALDYLLAKSDARGAPVGTTEGRTPCKPLHD